MSPSGGAAAFIVLTYFPQHSRSPQNLKYTEYCDMLNPFSSRTFLNVVYSLRSSLVPVGRSNITIIHISLYPLIPNFYAVHVFAFHDVNFKIRCFAETKFCKIYGATVNHLCNGCYMISPKVSIGKDGAQLFLV